jgi:type I restriction enzyme R subunit/putative DNA methylase
MQYLTPYELSKIMNDDENIIAEQGISAPSGTPSGWYSRGYLPHYNNTGTIQSVTFRLADAMPQSKLREIEAELVNMPTNKIDVQRRRKIEEWLD